jgi:hypothetical protein
MTDEEIQAEVKKYEFDTRCCCAEAGMCFAHAEMFRLVKRLAERARSEAVEEAAGLAKALYDRCNHARATPFEQGAASAADVIENGIRALAPRSQDEKEG